MTRKNVRLLIYYSWMRRLNGAEMSREINEACGHNTVTVRTCQRWVQQFEEGNFELDDRERSGRPSLGAELDDAIQDYLKTFPRASSVEIATAMNVSQSTLWEHMKKIGLTNLACRWVPHELSAGNKETRIRICNELLVKYGTNNFLPRLITVDETWIVWRNEGTYKQTKCWAGGDIPRVRNVSASITPDKTMAIFFWDSKGIIHWKLLQQGQTMTSEVYCELLDELKHSIEVKRRRSLDSANHGIHLLQDNARPHTSRVTTEKFRDLKLPCIPHPPYSPDLSPSDYYLFSSMKSYFSGNKFSNRNDVAASVNQWIDSKDENFFATGINMLPTRWRKCVEADGDYF